MRMVDIIAAKSDNKELTEKEINYFVEGYTAGDIPDYQASALLMAIYINGMTDNESIALTKAMLESGDKIDLSKIDGIKVDKHSTGGVGDKTTLILAPLVAYFGVPVAKMSGRGLGHTGGTIDKLESISGFQTGIEINEFIEQVNKIKCAVVGQTGNLTPADKKIYALRDVTGTVASIPLIASSIMSKKLASGANSIVLDVKVGSGAFMKNEDDARKLAELMVSIGNGLGRTTVALLTNMEEPLGLSVGNSLEVIEAIETLKGNGPEDLVNLSKELAAEMLLNAKKFNSKEDAIKEISYALDNGLAVDILKQMISSQKGDQTFVDDISNFESAKNVTEITSEVDGFVTHIDAISIGQAAMYLGAGRETKESVIDMSVGVVLSKKVGDAVSKGDIIASIHHNNKGENEAVNMIKKAYEFGNEKVDKKLVYDIIR